MADDLKERTKLPPEFEEFMREERKRRKPGRPRFSPDSQDPRRGKITKRVFPFPGSSQEPVT